MRNNFFVFYIRRGIKTISFLCVVLILGFLGDMLTKNIIETVSSNRLLPIYSVERNDKVVSLTFDCAWGSDDIPSIIETLNKHNVKAVFFTVGSWVDNFPDKVKLLSDNGMEIGNHSNSHAHVNKLSFEANVDDMKKCNKKISEITGKDVDLYRGPYGEYNNTVITAAESLNMNVIQWDIDTLDYTRKNTG